MKFIETPLKGAFVIEQEYWGDERGFFSRLLCSNEMADAGLKSNFVQINNSFSKQKGTLRGLHYQLLPSAEEKLMRCVRGSVFDVIVDLRPNSSTFLKWFGNILSADQRNMMYVPAGFAHGFVSLSDNVEVIYPSSARHAPLLERGLRWDDPAIKVEWPIEPMILSDKDRNWPFFDTEYHAIKNFEGL